jgi:hypothetical protein
VLTYAWEQVSGTTVDLANVDMKKAVLSFTAASVALDTQLTFKVTVSDGKLTAETTAGVNILAPKTAGDNNLASKKGGGSFGWLLGLIAFAGLRRKLSF